MHPLEMPALFRVYHRLPYRELAHLQYTRTRRPRSLHPNLSVPLDQGTRVGTERLDERAYTRSGESYTSTLRMLCNPGTCPR